MGSANNSAQQYSSIIMLNNSVAASQLPDSHLVCCHNIQQPSNSIVCIQVPYGVIATCVTLQERS